MKKIFAIYTLIGILCAPFIYSNNALSYKYKQYGISSPWGYAFGNSLYWPSYVFSIEPEIDGDTEESFENSLIKVMKYRKDKLFTGNGIKDIYLIGKSISSCGVENYLSNTKDKNDPIYKKLISQKLDNNDLRYFMDLIKVASKYKNYDELFEAVEKGDIKNIPDPNKYLGKNYNINRIRNIRKNIRERFDGYDFSDIIEEGADCEQSLTKNWSSYVNTISADKLTDFVTVPNIETNCDIDPKKVLTSLGLRSKRIDIHGPDDIDAASIGCPYRQSPKAGDKVKAGTIVSYRTWWEAG